MKWILTAILGALLIGCRQKSQDAIIEIQSTKAAAERSLAGSEKVNLDPDEVAHGPGEILIKENITVLDAAKIYERHSGNRVIMDKEIAEKELSFSLQGPLTNGEKAKFLQLTLLAEGFAIVPIPGEEEVVRIVESGPITTSGGLLGKPIWFEGDELPGGDEIIMFVMIFENISPEEGLQAFQSEFGAQTESEMITAVPIDSRLIITEPISLVRKMLEIKERIDVPRSGED